MDTLRSRGHFGGANQRTACFPQPHGQAEPVHQLVGLLRPGGLDRYGLRINFDDPLPVAREPSPAEADQYLESLKDPVGV
jgi:hypothetical protein